jgi:adenosylcobinamide kinase/adenosylcobinamide-phosphate guanylyltransferase
MTTSLPHLTFILGGARSGKSTFAQTLALNHGGLVLYVATAEAGDDEMAERIAIHRSSRPPTWQTLEAPRGVGAGIRKQVEMQRPDLVLLDCMTLLTSNVLLALPEAEMFKKAQPAMEAELDELIRTHLSLPIPWIIVSNEVGLDLVPPNPVGRLYRDLLGWVNQRLAAQADRVIFMIAGIPMVIKPSA